MGHYSPDVVTLRNQAHFEHLPQPQEEFEYRMQKGIDRLGELKKTSLFYSLQNSTKEKSEHKRSLRVGTLNGEVIIYILVR
jgi:hypothetical protein